MLAEYSHSAWYSQLDII